MILKNVLKNKNVFLLIITLPFIFFSIYISRFIHDLHHHGLMFVNALDLINNKVPYKEIFILYGIATTAIHSLSLLIFGENLISINIITNILYFFSTDYSKEDYLFLIIYKWALTNSIDLLWANSNDQNFINKLKEFFKVISAKPLSFASYSSDELINKTLKNGINNICAADSDNDIFQINNSY
jgi:hypothetical protein